MDPIRLQELADLARIELTGQERKEFGEKFTRLLDFVEKVQAYQSGTEGEPLALVEKLNLRDDIVRRFDWPQDWKHEYRVPKVIDFEEAG